MNNIEDILNKVRAKYPGFEIVDCLDNGDFYSFGRIFKGDSLEHSNKCVGGPTDIGFDKKNRKNIRNRSLRNNA